MKKLLGIGVAVMMCLFLQGCSKGLEEPFEETSLKEKATEIIQLFNDEKFSDIQNMGDATFSQPGVDVKLKEAWYQYKDKFGAFKEIESYDYASKDGNAAVIVIAVHENSKVQYTLNFNTDLKVTGLFFK